MVESDGEIEKYEILFSEDGQIIKQEKEDEDDDG